MHERIKPSTAAFLLFTSLAWQGIGFFAGMVPLLGTIWEWFGYAVFFIWFFLLGVSFMTGKNAVKKFGAMGGGLLIDSIPFLNVIPAQTVSVIYVILSTRKEDKERAEAAKAANDNAPRAANDNSRHSGRRAA